MSPYIWDQDRSVISVFEKLRVATPSFGGHPFQQGHTANLCQQERDKYGGNNAGKLAALHDRGRW